MSLLLPGLHLLSIEANLPETSSFRFEWKPPGEDWKEVPADGFFRLVGPGLLATYEARGAAARRFEPYPFYAFFPQTFVESFSSRWEGKLRVPSEGRRALRVTSNGQPRVLLDGKDLDTEAEIPGGVHAFTLQIRNVPEHARLMLEWQRPDGTIELVPPEAFTPPDAT
jgi:hypothetical protein